MIGIVAATLTTLSFVPQAIKVIKTRDTSGISLGMYVMFVTGILLWAIYGFIINDYPLIVSNIITLCLSGTILFFKIKYKK